MDHDPSLAQVQAGLEAVAADIPASFGRLDARQLTGAPTRRSGAWPSAWSTCSRPIGLMAQAGGRRWTLQPRTIPGYRAHAGHARLVRAALIRSQGPAATRKYTASPLALPAASEVAPDVVERFVTQDRELVQWLRGLDEPRALIMTSPSVEFIT